MIPELNRITRLYAQLAGGVRRAANYAATKAYVQSLGEALADEPNPYGVQVLLSSPGPTNSGFAARGHAPRQGRES